MSASSTPQPPTLAGSKKAVDVDEVAREQGAGTAPTRPRHLITLDARPTMIGYLGSLLRARELTTSIVRNDLWSRHSTLVLGWVWNVLDPLLMAAVYWAIFGLILAGRRPENFLAFVTVAMFLFRFMQDSMIGGANTLHRSVGMIRNVRFPRAVLPLAEVLRNLVTLYWQLPVVAIIVVATFGQLRPGWVTFLGVLIPLAGLFALGGAMLFARIAAAFADITRFLPYVFRIAFYASGVLFPIDAFLTDHPLGPWLPLNPFYAFITLARHLTLRPVAGTGALWISVLVWTLVLCGVGLRAFIGGERHYGRG